MPAPYSDNLYSAHDNSDDEPDALSPTDGYFHASSSSSPWSPSTEQGVVEPPTLASPAFTTGQRPFVPNVLVEDPTLRNPSGSKAREAQEEERLNSETTSQYHRRVVDEEQAAFSPPPRPFPRTTLEAPPAYTPSSGYQVFSPVSHSSVSPAMGRPDEQQPLIPRAPEGMGGVPGNYQDLTWWQRIKRPFASAEFRKRVKTLLGILVVLSIVSAIVGGTTVSANRKHKGDFEDKMPVKTPDKNHPNFKWDPVRGCLDTPFKFPKKTTALDLASGLPLSVEETINKTIPEGRGRRTPIVTGELYLQPADEASQGYIELEVISNDEDLSVTLEFDEKTQHYVFVTPSRVEWNSPSESPCIQIRVIVHAPTKSKLSSLNIDLVHLDLIVREGLVVTAFEGTNLASVSGDIKTPETSVKEDHDVAPYTLASRKISVKTVSADITGWFPLYDVLQLDSTSGDIKTVVYPKPADEKNPSSASLHVSTVSGDVKIEQAIDAALKSLQPDKEFPPRDYVVRITSTSGKVNADVAASSVADFRTMSGDMKLTVWPILDSSLLKSKRSAPHLSTDTKSGTTHLTLLEPLWTSLVSNMGKSQPPLSVHQGSHKSISGDIVLSYPNSWEGRLDAHSMSGSLFIRGKELDVTKTGDVWRRRVVGRKGSGHSQLTIDSISGSQNVLVGEEPEDK